MSSTKEDAMDLPESRSTTDGIKGPEHDEYVRIKRSELLSVLTLIDEMKKKLHALRK